MEQAIITDVWSPDHERHDQIVAEVVERGYFWDARDQGRLAFTDAVPRHLNPHDCGPLCGHVNVWEWYRGWDYEYLRKEHGRRIRDWCSNRFLLADEALYWEELILQHLVYHPQREAILSLPVESIYRQVDHYSVIFSSLRP